MNRLVYVFLAAIATLVVGTLNYSHERAQGPKPGETVQPSLMGFTEWTAGEHAQLGVHLIARREIEARSRSLGFFNSEINPVATIAFFDGEQELGSLLEVA